MDRSRIRPPYPTLTPSTSSAPSSAYHSCSSLASPPSPIAMPAQDHGESAAAATAGPQSAPLPSPTEQRSFFASLNTTSTQASTSQQLQVQQNQPQPSTQQSTCQAQAQMAQAPSAQHQAQAQLQQPTQQQQAVPQQMSTGFNYAPDRTGAGATAPETTAFLREYNLIAEAAKRAQVACMIRDLDAMDMS